MASVIKIKRSNVAGKVPTTSDIATGELALNTKDQKLYSSNGSAIFELGNAGALANTNAAINYIHYFGRIAVGSNTILATTANQTFTLLAGTGVTLAANPTTRIITIASSGGSSGGVGGYNNSTLNAFPGTTGDYDYGDGETYVQTFSSTDPFGVSLVSNFDCMDPIGSVQGPVDLNQIY